MANGGLSDRRRPLRETSAEDARVSLTLMCITIL